MLPKLQKHTIKRPSAQVKIAALSSIMLWNITIILLRILFNYLLHEKKLIYTVQSISLKDRQSFGFIMVL